MRRAIMLYLEEQQVADLKGIDREALTVNRDSML